MTFTGIPNMGGSPLPDDRSSPGRIDYTGIGPPPMVHPPVEPGPTDLGIPGQPRATLTAAQQIAKPVFWTYEQAQKEGRMEPTFEGKVNALLALAKQQGVVLWLGSGFRDDAAEKRAIKEVTDKHGKDAIGYWVAENGKSNHQKGEAADIFGDQGWLAKNAPQFGLVQPMSWESWHWEPAGLRGQSDPKAYTTGPPGSLNPTADPLLDSQPSEIMAHTAMLFGTPAGQTDPGASLAKAVTGGITDITGQVPGTTIPGTPSVPASSTRSGTVSAPGDVGVPVSAATTGGGGAATGEAANINRHTVGATPQTPAANQAEFVSTVVPLAEREAARTGIPAAVMIVQSALETGWGTSGWWRNNRNPAGIGVTGEPGKGYSYATLDEAFKDYAEHLLGHGEAGQEGFVAALRAGKPVEELLTELQKSPWAAGHYGSGTAMVDTYHALQASGMIAPNEAASSTPPQAAPPPTTVPPPAAPKPPPVAASSPPSRGRGSKRHI